MSHVFLTFLDTCVSAERKLVFQDALNTLAQANLHDAMFYIDQMMEQDDMDDTSAFLDTIEHMLMNVMHAALSSFGILVDDHASLALLTDMFKAILAMDNWSDPAALSTVCESDEGVEEILATLMAVTGSLHESDYLTHLMRVSPDLIERIDTLNQTFTDSALPTAEERSRAQRRTETYLATYSAPILSQAISEMLLIGGGFPGVMSAYVEAISALPLESAINEVVGFALTSDLPDKELAKAILTDVQGWWEASQSAAVQALVTTRLHKATAP